MDIIIALALMDLFALTIVTIILFLNHFVSNYQACEITVIDGKIEKVFTEEGGLKLLNCLNRNNIEVASSCGGKGTCGYCKVQVVEGAGEVLLTEEIFLTPKEMTENMRLSCQLKVRNNLKVVIPDRIMMVKEIVRNKKYNENKKWRVTVH